ncbi:hypothetical protein QVD99_008200 [Batrachochytrium dendrobatidis]|nr:hypothetical protein QVD99_008200 [Batrachochytrium dendrobatidis]
MSFINIRKCRLLTPSFQYRLYPRVRGKSTLFSSNQSQENPGVSIYIHFPYCESKCVYCSFNKYTVPSNGISHERIENALVQDLIYGLVHPVEALQKHYVPTQNQPSNPTAIHSIYFGGGTPSLARPEMVFKILEAAKTYGNLSNNTEITLEANPTSVEMKKLELFKQAGINRLSLGVQSLNDTTLDFLGRDHSAKESELAIATSVATFDNVSLDFIYGIPGQTLESWKQDLCHISQLGTAHLSLYQLTVERGTPLYRHIHNKSITMLDDDNQADFFEMTQNVMKEQQFDQYEVSSFVRSKNQNLRGIHNQSYWTGNDYIGVGPGAHGRSWSNASQRRFRTFRILEPNQWMDQCESIGHGARRCVPIAHKEMLNELIMLGLRRKDGISAQILDRFGGEVTLDSMMQNKLAILSRMEHELEWIVVNRNMNGRISNIRTTQKGLAFGDMMARELM